MKRLYILFILTMVIFTSGCNLKQESTQSSSNLSSVTAVATVTPTDNELKTKIIEQQSANDFSVFMDDRYVTLKDWDKDNYVTNILGKPIQESVKVLGEGADTYAGSSIKTLEYE